MMKTKLLIVAVVLGCGLQLNAQIKVGANVSTVNAASAIEIESTTTGILFPRLTTTQMNAISTPPEGLVIFNTTEGTLYHYYSSAWTSCRDGIKTIADSDNDTKIQVEESSDEDKIRFDVAGSEAMIIDAAGQVGIGTTTPAKILHVDAQSDSIRLENLAGTGDLIGIDNFGNLYKTSGTPVGSVQMYAGSSAPSGWISCDGTAISRTTYAALFAIVGTTYGVGDGSTTFNLPDLQGRIPVGSGAGSGLTSRTLGATGGEETHALSVGEMPAHSHNLEVSTDAGSDPEPDGNYLAATSEDTYNASSTSSAYLNGMTSAGSGTAHNVMQPFLVLGYIIKY